MFLVIPVRLEGIVDINRHTVAQAQYLDRLKESSLTGNLKAAVADSVEAGVRELASDIASTYASASRGIKPSDLRLVFSSDKITNGRVWAGAHVVSSKVISEVL